mmetsp:Transcript_18585/g.28704  ORF Transcript_18585/g.28704 Transcript_18585/m.28704 type:complete len:134 (-) Transcript_18585:199-600(-)
MRNVPPITNMVVTHTKKRKREATTMNIIMGMKLAQMIILMVMNIKKPKSQAMITNINTDMNTRKKKEESHDHEHKHEHGHKHGHAHKEEEDVPAWKKKALEEGATDPMAAPFGGSWNVESSLSASDKKDKMEE